METETDRSRALKEGFLSVDNMWEEEGAWSIGFCCYRHMVLYLDNVPNTQPIKRDEVCYKEVKQHMAQRALVQANTIDRKQRMRERTRQHRQAETERQEKERTHRRASNVESRDRRTVFNTLRKKEQVESPEEVFSLKGQDLHDLVAQHRRKTRLENSRSYPRNG